MLSDKQFRDLLAEQEMSQDPFSMFRKELGQNCYDENDLIIIREMVELLTHGAGTGEPETVDLYRALKWFLIPSDYRRFTELVKEHFPQDALENVMPDGCDKSENKPCMLPDDHPVRRMGDLGNQVHNLGCELQNDEDVSAELGEIACLLWGLEKDLRVRTKVELDRENLAKVINDAYVRADKWQVSYLDVADAILAAGFTKPD